jgi:4a-hydroxytetrahydrobiopterin dehydratase
MALLTELQRQEFAVSHPDWRVDGDTIRRQFTFTDFVEAMGFVTRVALLAEKSFHHPDIDIRWNAVTLALSTHSEGGLTGKDVDLAAAIDPLSSD